jgi:hypothetical protein
MNGTLLRGLTACSLLCAVVAHADRAFAWESWEERRIRTFPSEVSLGTFPLHREAWESRYFSMQLLKDAIGGSVPDRDNGFTDDGLTKVFRCLDPANTQSTDNCRTASPDDLGAIGAGWIAARKAGDTAHGSEHTLIARESARLAGLLGPSTELFEPFWVRYPAANGVVGSTLFPQTQTARPMFLVAQSLQPVPMVPDHFSYAARGISLLELAQTPDFSNSLSDWANGNELCPLAGLEGAYRNANLTEVCHQFNAAMGALNVTHFAPLNREMWRYYHGLARQKMMECNALAPLESLFYDPWESNWYEYKIPSDEHTETHECERLAMTYEMFGQHFLQDAWAVGHMWQRWGLPRLSEFPPDVLLSGEEVFPSFPARHLAPRRALLAGVAAAVGGTIHGTKSLIASKARDLLVGQFVGQPDRAKGAYQTLLDWRAFDDPLNGGSFNGQRIEWIAADNSRHPGAGDLFWDPELRVAGAPVVSSDDTHSVQRTSLLTCAAASMRRVYDLGPHAHGPPAPDVPTAVLALDPDSEQCWDHWATNASMLAAIGPVSPAYVDGIATILEGASQAVVPIRELALGSLMLNLTNSVVIKEFAGDAPSNKAGVVDFPTEKRQNVDPHDTELLALVDDRDRIIDRVGAALNGDMGVMRFVYSTNALLSPNGTDSAQQRGYFGGEVKLLGISSVPTETESAHPRGVDYVDRLPSDGEPHSDLSMSRIFWRGDLPRTCRMAVADNAAVLNALKQECSADSAWGGDAEACTGCVALAELLIPPCAGFMDANVLDSKCTAVGVGSASATAPGLPSWWFDNLSRHHREGAELPPEIDRETQDLCGVPPYYLAAQWCASAFADNSDDSASFSHDNNDFELTTSVECSNGLGTGLKRFGTWSVRQATIMIERTNGVGVPWLPPMVSSYDRRFTTRPGEDPCNALQTHWTDSIEERQWATVPGMASVYELLPGTYAGADQPRCGITQRVTTWNRTCSDANQWVGMLMPTLNEFKVDTGAFAYELFVQDPNTDPATDYGTECLLREPRSYRTCPLGLECSPGGECVVPHATPPGFLSLDPPSPGG